MGRKNARSKKSSSGRATTDCFRIGFRTARSKPEVSSVSRAQKKVLLGDGGDDDRSDSAKSVPETGNKIMVVVDTNMEARGALDWALSHAVQTSDSIILIHVAKQGYNGSVDMKITQLLLSMKHICQLRRPGVQVEVKVVQGNERGPIIVEEAKKQKVSLLVLGQRKRSILRHLISRLAAARQRLSAYGGTHSGVVEYCIRNSPCMTVAVRQKSQKIGGYLITTKRHKNFWLLA